MSSTRSLARRALANVSLRLQNVPITQPCVFLAPALARLSPNTHPQRRTYAKAVKDGGKGKQPAAPAKEVKVEEAVSAGQSAAPAGTVLSGLSILKDRPDPIAGSDESYPPWLWAMLDDPSLTRGAAAAENAGMTKGEARMATKRAAKAARAGLRKGAASTTSGAGAKKEGVSSAGTTPLPNQEQVAGAQAEQAVRATETEGPSAAELAQSRQHSALRKANRAAIKARNFLSAS